MDTEAALGYAITRVKEALPSDRVIAELVDLGISEETARALVDRVLAMKRDAQTRDIAVSLLKQGKSASKVGEALVSSGVERAAAEALVKDLVQLRGQAEEERRRAEREAALYSVHRERGPYNATIHVCFGAALHVGAVGGIIMLCGEELAHRLFSLTDVRSQIFNFVGFPVGVVTAVLIYRGRWARVEAYSSRFCSGIVNLSTIYVPLIAFVYATVLVVQDVSDRLRSPPAAR
jgi:hypothetical protein